MGMNDPIYEAPRFFNFLSETVIGRMIEFLSYIHALNAFLVAANYFRLTVGCSVEYRVQLKKAEGCMLQFNMTYNDNNENNGSSTSNNTNTKKGSSKCGGKDCFKLLFLQVMVVLIQRHVISIQMQILMMDLAITRMKTMIVMGI